MNGRCRWLLSYSKSFPTFHEMQCLFAGIDGGNDVDGELLTGIYERVRDCEFKPGSDHVSQVVRIEQMIVGKKPVSCLPCC